MAELLWRHRCKAKPSGQRTEGEEEGEEEEEEGEKEKEEGKERGRVGQDDVKRVE